MFELRVKCNKPTALFLLDGSDEVLYMFLHLKSEMKIFLLVTTTFGVIEMR